MTPLEKLEAYMREQEGNSIGIPEEAWEAVAQQKEERLPYPTEWVAADGKKVEKYLIPESEKMKVLQALYPFEPVPSLDDAIFDLHENQIFCVKNFMVLRFQEQNWLCSPYYFSTGGTVIDWVSLKQRDEGVCSMRLKECSSLDF